MSKPLAMCAAALAVAACTTSDSSMVSGGVGQGQVIGGVTSGVETAGKAVLSPILPSSYSNWGYTDAAGVYHRYDRWGYYDANGTYVPYNDPRGAWCARWDTVNNTCIWWLTG